MTAYPGIHKLGAQVTLTRIIAIMLSAVLLAGCAGGTTERSSSAAGGSTPRNPSSGSSTSSSSSGGGSTTPSTEEKLDALFGGSSPAIGSALDQAANNCPESRTQIADYVTYMMQELGEKKPGHGENPATLAGAIATSARDLPQGMNCAEIAATLLVMMIPGN